MEIPNIVTMKEVTDCTRANKYKALGWTVLNTYVKLLETWPYVNQQVYYVLAWIPKDPEDANARKPKYPNDIEEEQWLLLESSYLRP